MRTESTLQPDPEAKPTKLVGKEVEIAEKDLSSLDHRDVSIDGGSMEPTYDHTHRKLKPRHLQLIGIGGTIGTVLYVQIGSGLRTSGPASLFLGFSIWLVVFFVVHLSSPDTLPLCTTLPGW
jgi:amino acid transporter